MNSGGNAYVTGFTGSNDFPTMPHLSPLFSQTVFIAKLNASGSALVYSTYLGGAAGTYDVGNAIAVDATGAAYVAGAPAEDAIFFMSLGM